MDVLIDIFAGVFGVATARNRHPGGTPLPPRFYQTKPFVMLAKWHLYFWERVGCVDYRKMTNGFVFLETENERGYKYPSPEPSPPRGEGKGYLADASEEWSYRGVAPVTLWRGVSLNL